MLEGIAFRIGPWRVQRVQLPSQAARFRFGARAPPNGRALPAGACSTRQIRRRPLGFVTTTTPGIPIATNPGRAAPVCHVLQVCGGDSAPVPPAMSFAARKQLLAQEKEHTRRGDELADQRSRLPWVPVEKEYRLDTEEGPKTLAELFDGRSQLVVYHFMFGAGYASGCPTNSSIADSFDGLLPHFDGLLPHPGPRSKGTRRGRRIPIVAAPPRRIRRRS